MPRKTITDQSGVYFLTCTVTEWADVFTRKEYRDVLINSLRFCIQNKGLQLYSWCIMSNHIHFIASAAEGYSLPDIIRDFKRHTATTILNSLKQDTFESRREWLLRMFTTGNERYRFWAEGNEPKIIYSNNFFDQKLNYIHENPVKAGLVLEAEHYVYSSAFDYAGGKGLLDIVFA
ncbi:MAG: transposase [Bacteroidia bacterium]|nr:transposase [Bacteroidia bacterium]MBP7260668.1 transposase [Bacteroidia bacterium]MBP9181145.1 transposase [Bacteroidia bacterium]MBP9724310.1 transposase [Bacteroidia bacterium]